MPDTFYAAIYLREKGLRGRTRRIERSCADEEGCQAVGKEGSEGAARGQEGEKERKTREREERIYTQ